MNRAALASLTLARPELLPVLHTHLREHETGDIPAQRTPWARPGWFARASSWMDARLRECGLAPLSPIETRKTWSISCVLQAQTAAGKVFLKAPSRHFAAETRSTAWVAAHFADRVPRVLVGTWTLGVVHQALSYLQIIRSQEPSSRFEWKGDIGEWLRAALTSLETEPEEDD